MKTNMLSHLDINLRISVCLCQEYTGETKCTQDAELIRKQSVIKQNVYLQNIFTKVSLQKIVERKKKTRKSYHL